MYIILNTYDRGQRATEISQELWERHVPTMLAMPDLLATLAAESVDDGSRGVSITFFETREAAQAYLDSSTRESLDNEASFRTASDRRIYRVLNSTFKP
jgi:heme-degrading monooxygenase HmoA